MGVTLSQRVVDRVAVAIAGRGFTRRRFLQRAALVGSALAVDPLGYALKPRTAHATVCGNEPECTQGWTAFCCTISGGANLCPPGSFAAGWWKVDGSSFCRGEARYYIDCNRSPDASCSCGCADGECDRRRVCCNVFRYGQCNQQIPGATEVVCRVILCTPPWEWDPTCTSTSRTDPATATHSSTCLPGPNPSHIEIKYQDLGLNGSVLGDVTRPEQDTVRDGRVTLYEVGLILWRSSTGAHVVHGNLALAYARRGREEGDLGFPVRDQGPIADGRYVLFEFGGLWDQRDTGIFATLGEIHERYLLEDGASGWLGFPVEDQSTLEDGLVRQAFEGGTITFDPETGRTSVGDGDAAPSAVERWSGDDRIGTAVEVSRRAFVEGAPVVHVARADDFADALGGGVAAAALGGPLLLTVSADLPSLTRKEIIRLGSERAVVLGGEVAVEPVVVDDVKAAVDGGTERVAGADRYETAAKLVELLHAPEGVTTVYLASGEAFPDALAGAPFVARNRAPLLLTRRADIPAVIEAQLARLRPSRIVLLGGPAAIIRPIEEDLRARFDEVIRLGGEDRFETAVAIADAWDTAETVFVVNGRDFPDALAAGPAAALFDAPILLVERDQIPGPTVGALERLRPARIVVVGGPAVVSPDVVTALDRFAITPGG